MLTEVAEGVLVHESEFIQSNSVVVQGSEGVLLIDPGITRSELAALADDIRRLGRTIVAGFATHPDWDHVLWHAEFGDAPRYGTARCAASIQDLLSKADWKARVAEGLPPEYAEEIPMDLLGLGLAVVGVLLYGQVRSGLDYYCITTMLPSPAGSDPDAAPVGSFSWFPAGISCRYPQIAGNGWAARLPGWDMSISALVAALMVLTGALRLRRQRRPNR